MVTLLQNFISLFIDMCLKIISIQNPIIILFMLSISSLKGNDRNSLDIKGLSFHRFLQIMQEKNQQKKSENTQIVQLRKIKKQNILERVKILPPHLVESIQKYSPRHFPSFMSRKVSINHVIKHMHSEQTPFTSLRIQNKAQKMPNWKRQFRKDELNSMRFSTSSRNIDQQMNEQMGLKTPKVIKVTLPKYNKKDIIKRFSREKMNQLL